MLTVNFDYINVQPGEFILDLGCGEGRHSIGAAHHKPEAKVIAVDLNMNDIKAARQKDTAFFTHPQCAYLNSDGTRLPFLDHSFNHVICSEVLEHIPNVEKMLGEIQRVLKPGGSLTISVPRYWPEKICWFLSSAYHQVEGGHIRIFKAKKLRNKIVDLNFTHRKSHWSHALHSPYWWLKCMLWKYGDDHFLVKAYHAFLVWDLMKKPWLTRAIDKILNPFIGKSIVIYFFKNH